MVVEDGNQKSGPKFPKSVYSSSRNKNNYHDDLLNLVKKYNIKTNSDNKREKLPKSSSVRQIISNRRPVVKNYMNMANNNEDQSNGNSIESRAKSVNKATFLQPKLRNQLIINSLKNAYKFQNQNLHLRSSSQPNLEQKMNNYIDYKNYFGKFKGLMSANRNKAHSANFKGSFSSDCAKTKPS